MKLYLIPILCLSACSTQPARKAILINPPGQSIQETAGLRSPEQIRAYQLGRYADSGDRTVMHEAHPVYRIEKTASWNLKPKGVGSSADVSKAATATERDAFTAELNRQRVATKALTEQAAALAEHWSSLNATLNQTKMQAEQYKAFREDLNAIKSRLNHTENRMQTLSPASAPAEVKW